MVGSHHLLKEAFCRRNVTRCTQHKLYRVAFFIDRAIEVLPLRSYLDVRLIYPVGSTRQLQVGADSLADFRSRSVNPSPDGRVVYGQPALAHQFFKVTIRK